MLSWRLFFDPGDVGLREPAPWSDPPETALELGLRRPSGRSMAGIDYLASTGSEVRAWSDVLPDPVQADERGGRVPFLIHHGQRELPPPERFGPLLGRALREAAAGLLDRAVCEEVAADFRAVQTPTLALVRPGPRVAARLDGKRYALLVRGAAAALGRYGVPVVEPEAVTALMAQQLLRDAPGFLLDWDYQLLGSMLVAQLRAGEQQTEESRRLQAVTSGVSATLTPGWVVEPGSPLAELAATRRSGAAALTVVVTAAAALPKDGAPQAAAWLQSALNGGERGRRRAVREVAGARHVGAVALARARLGAALRQPLPGRTRRAVEDLREACRARLLEDAVLSDGRLLAESVAQLLVTYARHPAEAEDVLAAIDAVLGAGGRELPLLVVFGRHNPLLLPVPRVDPSWAELARAHLAAGYEAEPARSLGSGPQRPVRAGRGPRCACPRTGAVRP